MSRIEDAPSLDRAVRVACGAYLPLMRSRQFFSHTTAALLWRCPLPREFDVALPLHVTSIAPNRAVERVDVTGHQSLRGTTSWRYGFPVADPTSLFLQLATILGLDDLVAVADHLVLDPAVLDPSDIRPYVTAEALHQGVAASTGRGCRAAASAVLLMRQGAESRRETLLRLMLGRAGFPEPEVNAVLHSDEGRWLGRADLVYREWKVIVEYDGDQHRSNVRQYEEDIARVERFTRAGWVVVKVRASGLFAGEANTITRVERALSARGWRR